MGLEEENFSEAAEKLVDTQVEETWRLDTERHSERAGKTFGLKRYDGGPECCAGTYTGCRGRASRVTRNCKRG